MTDLVLRPRGTYSQAQQDTILKTIFDSVGATNKVCVEFGFNSLTLEGGSGSNVARLVIEEGWTGILFDKDLENPSINLHRIFLTPENICSVFAQHAVPTAPDYVSIDVDSIDLWLFRSLLLGGYRPRVISVEYNSNYGTEECVTVRPGTVNTDDRCYGASLAAMYDVGREFGYQLVDIEPGLDLFFVVANLWKGSVLTLAECQPFVHLFVHPVPTEARVLSTMMEYPCRAEVRCNA